MSPNLPRNPDLSSLGPANTSPWGSRRPLGASAVAASLRNRSLFDASPMPQSFRALMEQHRNRPQPRPRRNSDVDEEMASDRARSRNQDEEKKRADSDDDNDNDNPDDDSMCFRGSNACHHPPPQ